MKTFIYILFIVSTFLFTSCEKENNNEPANIIVGEWQMTEVALLNNDEFIDYTDDCNTKSTLTISETLNLEETEYAVNEKNVCILNPHGKLNIFALAKNRNNNYQYDINSKHRLIITFEDENTIKRSFTNIELDNNNPFKTFRYDIWKRKPKEELDVLAGNWKMTKTTLNINTEFIDYTDDCNTKSTLVIDKKLNLEETEYAVNKKDECILNPHGKLNIYALTKNNDNSYQYNINSNHRLIITFESNNTIKRSFTDVRLEDNDPFKTFRYDIWERE